MSPEPEYTAVGEKYATYLGERVSAGNAVTPDIAQRARKGIEFRVYKSHINMFIVRNCNTNISYLVLRPQLFYSVDFT